ncbi:Uncharacterised protein [Mycobacterium tuberculosis]|uniref:Uncharacterized protein n=1 Tax=Mycobacterium tuberculosis TaxID=1773 RepID=A0A916P8F9_MYCTX|nr:Uncharacterised protein [Mycobacterium tuberculosis]COX63234.1 Uncharacterised protein [Mycobacterium tuberculosis]COY56697.1 Uncharacterised protein [Mycobacterium tuberculosis]COZ70171.1 Uncharacterised protein [Mycobacterium tuberculosis]
MGISNSSIVNASWVMALMSPSMGISMLEPVVAPRDFGNGALVGETA